MSEFSGFADEAKKLADEHPDIADKAVDEAGQFADDKTGGKFDSQVQDAEQRADGFFGADNQDSSGSQ